MLKLHDHSKRRKQTCWQFNQAKGLGLKHTPVLVPFNKIFNKAGFTCATRPRAKDVATFIVKKYGNNENSGNKCGTECSVAITHTATGGCG